MNENMRAYVAEMIGTFGLCFIGAGAICTDAYTNGGVGLLGIAVAHGLVLSMMITVTGYISGGHHNPAVTFAMLITKNISLTKAVGYVVSQIVGAIIAGFALRAIFAPAAWAKVQLGTPALNPGVTFANGILIEAILTFFLVFVIFGVAIDPRRPKHLYGFAIGLTICFDILVGGPLTGASMNPARTLGPGLAAGYFQNHLVYWIGPLLGAAVAALVFQNVLMQKKGN
jgi:MIP family channel proteins